MSFIFTYSRNAITVFLNGIPKVVDNTHVKWDEIFAIISGEVEATEEELAKLVDTRAAIQAELDKVQFGRVTVGQDAILLDGKPVHNHLTQRMLELIEAKLDIAPWARFMDKLAANPSKTAVDELYLWLEKANMPLTANGNFLAYKKVNRDYTSFHNNADGTKCHNQIGTMVQMPRNEVDDNRNRTCSQGLHFCSFTYLPSYYGNQGRVVIVEIDPADVVSIPSDYDNAKGRAWRYLVRGEVAEKDTEFAFQGVLVADDSEYDDQWDDEYDDESEEYDEVYDEDYDLDFDQDGYVAYLDNIDEDDWVRGDVTPLTTGGFAAYLKDGNENKLFATYDRQMNLLKAKKVL